MEAVERIIGSDVVLLWLDDHIGQAENCIELKQEFESNTTNIYFFNDVDQCRRFLSSIRQKKLFCIIQGRHAQSIVPDIIKYGILPVVYIFCFDMSSLTRWASDIECILAGGIFTHEKDLLARLTQDLSDYANLKVQEYRLKRAACDEWAQNLTKNAKRFRQEQCTLTYATDPFKEYTNQLDKIYEINLHGKFTVIVRRSFVRLHVHPTTHVNPCYLYDLSSICDSEMIGKSNLIDNYSYLDENRKEKKRKLIHRKMRKLITHYKKAIKENKSSTFFVYASKSTIRPLSDDCDSDDSNNNDQYFESINSSTIGEILSDLIHHEVHVADANPNLEPSTDLLTFLSDTSEICHILRTIITKKYSCQLLNPKNFLQYQYLIDILQSSEFILEYLRQFHSHEKVFLIEILTHLYQILSSMNNNSYKCQYICQCLFDILQKLNRKKSSYSQ
ncbi:unnamed protein product [Rotaria sp. Silwood1]|nr:unnamed protein product [Rotaria sp. Silwood1]